MKTRIEQFDYNDLETIVQNARMQRSVAVGDAIAGLMALVVSGFRRAVAGLRGAAPARAEQGLEVPAHR